MFVKPRCQTTDATHRLVTVLSVMTAIFGRPVMTRGSDGPQTRSEPPVGVESTTGEIVVERGVRITMRDGSRLVADLFRPPGASRVPLILARTPYGRHIEGTLYGRYFAERGYAFVAQDIRGRFDSEGEWAPFHHEGADGYDSIEWGVQQHWCNGNVAMFGASYGAMCAWYASTTRHPNLHAVVSMVNVADPDQFMPFTGGVFHIGFAGWAKMLEALESPAGLAMLPSFDWEKAAQVRPLTDLDSFFKTKHTYVDEALQHPLHDRAYWDKISYARGLSDANVAGLHISGWFDVHRTGTFSTYERLRGAAATEKARDAQHLIIGPWAHLGVNRSQTMGAVDFGPDAVIDLNETMVRFLDRHLKGAQNDFGQGGRVRLFVTGENQWRVESEWPPIGARFKTLLLSSTGKANRRDGSGSLIDATAVATNHEFDEFRYDPAHPPPFLGSMALYPLPDHTADKAALPDRNDVLDYRSEAAAAPVDLLGPVRVVLFVSTSAPDTDFAMELFRVTPDGSMYRLTGGIKRLRYHLGCDQDRPVAPGTVARIVIDCPPIGCRLQPGNRLHLQIGSAAVPAYAPNLNTLDPADTAVTMVTTTSRVWHTPDRPSCVIIPTVTVATPRAEGIENASP